MACMSSVTRVRVLSRRSTTRLLLGAVFCALVLVGTSTLAGASPSKASSGAISAHLTKKSFTKAQAGSVKLIYKFSAPSKSFAYPMTVKKVFAGKPVKVGSYRLKLSAEAQLQEGLQVADGQERQA